MDFVESFHRLIVGMCCSFSVETCAAVFLLKRVLLLFC
jgi:hypothetical protein